MSPGGSSVRVDRVVAVAVTLRDGREQLGSGYLVGRRLVLTAEHCTRDKVTGEPAARLRVVRASDAAAADVVGVVRHRGLDVAVLQLADDAPWDADLPPVLFARVDRSQSGVLDDCTGIGFALFQRDPDRRTRHTSEFHGRVYQTDERESGRLLMREPLIHPGPVAGPEDQALSGRGEEGSSPWGGLSGALMFYRGRAIGVVVEHHPRQGDSALRAIGFERIAAASAEIRQCLGLPPPDSLPRVSGERRKSTAGLLKASALVIVALTAVFAAVPSLRHSLANAFAAQSSPNGPGGNGNTAPPASPSAPNSGSHVSGGTAQITSMQLLTKQTSGPHYQVHIRLYKLPSKNYTLWLVALIYPKAGVINETLYFAKAPVRETVGGQSVEIQYCHSLKPDLQRGLEVVAADAAASRILAANQIEENNPATCASNADLTSLPGTEVISNVYRFVAAP